MNTAQLTGTSTRVARIAAEATGGGTSLARTRLRLFIAKNREFSHFDAENREARQASSGPWQQLSSTLSGLAQAEPTFLLLLRTGWLAVDQGAEYQRNRPR